MNKKTIQKNVTKELNTLIRMVRKLPVRAKLRVCWRILRAGE